MSTEDSQAEMPTESQSRTVDDRTERALSEHMAVLPEFGDAKDADGLFVVVGENDEHEQTYMVDADAGRCTCKDARLRGVRCKHLRRVMILTGRELIPTWLPDVVDVDDNIGANVETNIRFVMPDGGLVETESDVDAGNEIESDAGRPEACTCLACFDDDGLPCFFCYSQGFSRPNPNAPTKADESAQAGGDSQ